MVKKMVEKKVFEIQKKNDQFKKIYVHDIFIDQQWLKTTQDGKINYWKVVGSLFISKNDPNKTLVDDGSAMIEFRVNLLASEKTFGADEVSLKIDLKRAVDNFKKNLKNHALNYNVIPQGSWNDKGLTMEYDGWIELKVQKYCYDRKVSIFELPNWLV